jgi:hypothetical protein
MRKILSFCVYGDDPKYTIGMLKNIELCPLIYGDEWGVRIYLDKTVPLDMREKYTELGADVIDMSESSIEGGMFWRFLPFDDPSVDVFCVRDADSRISLREKEAVEEWISTGTALHIMRDHPHHNYVILGGMFGFNNRAATFSFLEKYNKFSYDGYKFKKMDDMRFLGKLYQENSNSCVAHDLSPHRWHSDNNGFAFNPLEGRKGFPSPRDGLQFVGEIHDAEDVPSFQRSLLK